MSLTPPFLLLDRYDVSAEIGRGGHAIVYRAHDRVFDRAVAIKLLRDDALSPDVLARFRQEIQLTARLEHAHILHVYDTGTFEGLPYVVMELASGQTLADRLAREPQLPIADALQITRDVGLALAHAHTRGIVHRDVKPENILLGSGGAMLADFGVARVTADQAVQRITSTGMAVGTLQYMSPEQLCAEPIVDERSDQYALACVLYEMLAGVRPHTSASLEGLRMLRLTGQHAPVSAHRPSVPAEVEEALQIAMAVAPADRFRHIDEFLAALGVVQTGEQVAARMSSGGLSRAGARSGRGMPAVTAAREPRTSNLWRRVGGGLGVATLAAAALWWRGSISATGSGAASGVLEAGALTVTLAPSEKGADSLDVLFLAKVREELQTWPGVDAQESEQGGGLRIAPLATPLADRVQLRLDVRADSATSWRIVREVPASSADWSPVIASMVREALSGRPASEVPGLDLLGERSLPALRAYAQGFVILRETGMIDSAARAFRAARDASPGFAPAHFWAAQSSAWKLGNPSDSWRTDADAAVRLGTLHGVDSLLAAGLQHLAAEDYPQACASYQAAIERSPTSFVGWSGLGQCQYDDKQVVEREGRPQFRSSHWAAMRAYLEAARHAESSALLAALFPRMRRATYSGGVQARQGLARETRRRYFAQPSFAGDTLAFVPVAAEIFGDPSTVPSTWAEALRRSRQLGVNLTAQWVDRFPTSPQGWIEHALSLELAGQIDPRDLRPNHSAPAALSRVDAQRISTEMLARLALARSRLALRRGDTADAFAEARRALAGIAVTDRGTAAILLPLAALIGDSAKVTALHYPDSERRTALPTVVSDTLDAFERAALLGQCGALNRLYPVLERLATTSIAAAELATLRDTWLLPIYRAAVPCLGARILIDMQARGPLDEAIQALARSDTARARSVLTAARQRLRGASAASVTWDRQTVEAWTLAQTGDTAQAIARLDAAVSNLASMSLSTLEYADQAAGLREGLRLLRDLRKRAITEKPVAESR